MSDKYEKITEAQEGYIRMYHEFFVLHWTWNEICEKHQCSKANVSKAVKWVMDNRLEFPAKLMIQGAIDTISSRLKINQELLNKELKKKRSPDKRFIIALNQEVREDEKAVYKLMNVIDDGSSEHDGKIEAADVLKLIAAANKDTSN